MQEFSCFRRNGVPVLGAVHKPRSHQEGVVIKTTMVHTNLKGLHGAVRVF